MSIVKAINELSGKEAVTIEDAIRNVDISGGGGETFMPTVFTWSESIESLKSNYEVGTIEKQLSNSTTGYIPCITLVENDNLISYLSDLMEGTSFNVALGQNMVVGTSESWVINKFASGSIVFFDDLIQASCLTGYYIFLYGTKIMICRSSYETDKDEAIASFFNMLDNAGFKSVKLSVFIVPTSNF